MAEPMETTGAGAPATAPTDTKGCVTTHEAPFDELCALVTSAALQGICLWRVSSVLLFYCGHCAGCFVVRQCAINHSLLPLVPLLSPSRFFFRHPVSCTLLAQLLISFADPLTRPSPQRCSHGGELPCAAQHSRGARDHPQADGRPHGGGLDVVPRELQVVRPRTFQHQSCILYLPSARRRVLSLYPAPCDAS